MTEPVSTWFKSASLNGKGRLKNFQTAFMQTDIWFRHSTLFDIKDTGWQTWITACTGMMEIQISTQDQTQPIF
ncbi:hypothetical protein [Neisseria sp.]|uniref:hypothetical protein n=1 Tax=Neisseria sp. TaxID=192066 RepID=UPI0035A14B84